MIFIFIKEDIRRIYKDHAVKRDLFDIKEFIKLPAKLVYISKLMLKYSLSGIKFELIKKETFSKDHFSYLFLDKSVYFGLFQNGFDSGNSKSRRSFKSLLSNYSNSLFYHFFESFLFYENFKIGRTQRI